MRSETTVTLTLRQDHKNGTWIVEKITATTETREFESPEYANEFMMSLMNSEGDL